MEELFRWMGRQVAEVGVELLICLVKSERKTEETAKKI
jgi:hypothetical protein